EADRAPFLARRLSELLEERPDPPGRHPLPHGDERWRGDEHERHARLLRHRLGQEGLPGARRPLEEDAAPWRPAELVPEGRVSQEDVEGPDHLVDLRLQTFDLAESD